MRVYNYNDDVQQMVADVRSRNHPAPFHVDLLPWPGPSARDGLFVVATWNVGDEIYLAWQPAPDDMPGQLKLRQLWAGYGQLAGFSPRYGLADARCWPPPDDRPGWFVEWRSATKDECPICGSHSLQADAETVECPRCGSHGRQAEDGTFWLVRRPDVKHRVG